eukprot:1243433-Rhodomonas_salina.3
MCFGFLAAGCQCSSLYCSLVAFAARAAPLVAGRHQHSHSDCQPEWAVLADHLVVWHMTVPKLALGVVFPTQ